MEYLLREKHEAYLPPVEYLTGGYCRDIILGKKRFLKREYLKPL